MLPATFTLLSMAINQGINQLKVIVNAPFTFVLFFIMTVVRVW